MPRLFPVFRFRPVDTEIQWKSLACFYFFYLFLPVSFMQVYLFFYPLEIASDDGSKKCEAEEIEGLFGRG